MPGAGESNEKQILATLPRIEAAAEEMAKLFAARGGTDDALAAGHLLGGVAAASWAARLSGRRAPLRGLVERVRVRTEGSSAHAPAVVEDDDAAPSSAIVRVLLAARSGNRPRLVLGPRAARYAEPVGRVLGDLVEGPAETADSVEQERSPSVVVVTPYYWDKRDLDRLVRHLALEAIAPAPGTSVVHLLVASGWEQRRMVLDAVGAALERAGAGDRLRVEPVDEEGAEATLRSSKARVAELGARRVSLVVHPMWRERAEVEREIAAIAALSDVDSVTVGHRASMPWVFGCGAFGQRARLDFWTAVPALDTPSSARQRVSATARPSAAAAVKRAVLSRI